METKIIERIKKMLALANNAGATEGERDAALSMVHKTLVKYNLSMGDVEAHGQEERERGDMVLYSMIWSKTTIKAIADLFFCFYAFGEKVNAHKCKHIFIGKESNVETAKYMSEYIVLSILKEARKCYGHALTPEGRSFCLGAAHKISARMKVMQAESVVTKNGTGTDVVLASYYQSEKDANLDFMSKIGMRTAMVPVKNSKVNIDAYRSGDSFGGKVNLNLQVGASKKTTLMLK